MLDSSHVKPRFFIYCIEDTYGIKQAYGGGDKGHEYNILSKNTLLDID